MSVTVMYGKSVHIMSVTVMHGKSVHSVTVMYDKSVHSMSVTVMYENLVHSVFVTVIKSMGLGEWGFRWSHCPAGGIPERTQGSDQHFDEA